MSECQPSSAVKTSQYSLTVNVDTFSLQKHNTHLPCAGMPAPTALLRRPEKLAKAEATPTAKYSNCESKVFGYPSNALQMTMERKF